MNSLLARWGMLEWIVHPLLMLKGCGWTPLHLYDIPLLYADAKRLFGAKTRLWPRMYSRMEAGLTKKQSVRALPVSDILESKLRRKLHFKIWRESSNEIKKANKFPHLSWFCSLSETTGFSGHFYVLSLKVPSHDLKGCENVTMNAWTS